MTDEMRSQARHMAKEIALYGAEYQVGEHRQMAWSDAGGRQYRGTVGITAELLRRVGQELAVLRDSCPVCGDPLPVAQRDRRVAYNGLVVCDRATCEAQTDG